MCNDNRCKKALEIIANKHGQGNSFLWAEMQEIANYALTGNYKPNNTWPMSLQDKDIIDMAGINGGQDAKPME